MRTWLVLALVCLAWTCLGDWSLANGAGLGLAALLGFACTRSASDRVRRLAPLAPATALLVRTFMYAAAPLPLRPVLGLAVLLLAALVCHLALHPLAAVSRPAKFAARLTLSLAAVLTVLTGAERLYREFVPLNPYWIEPEEGGDEIFVEDAELGLALRPGFRGRFVHLEYGRERVELNADGFRDRPWSGAGAAGGAGAAPRDGVLLLGDSTLFGFGVEQQQTIPALLERELARTSAREWRVYNGGVPGYGPPHELGVLQRWSERLSPRVCAFVFYDGNDLDDCRKAQTLPRPAAPGAMRTPEVGPPPGAPAPPDFLARALPTPPLWSRAYWMRYSLLGRRLEHVLADQLVALGWVPLDVACNNEFLRAARIEPDALIAQELELAWNAIAAAAEHCRARGIAFVLVRLPGAVQVEPGTFRVLLERLEQDPARFARARPGSLLVQRARAQGLPALDLLPVLEVAEGQVCPYYFREGHPSAAGNQRIAAELGAFLLREGLLGEAR
ncbi:MAG: hypothetical protein EXS08_02085 [Planctomycetes bacterium]|nr:hypothetical protein [Planctomycetota bacterium]